MSAKRSKYGNSKVVVDGITFDSKREAERYRYLKEAEAQGLIKNLELQPKYELIPAVTEVVYKQLKTKVKEEIRTIQKPIYYKADFRYNKVNSVNPMDKVVEDVKISEFMLPKEFLLKEKLLFWRYRIKIRRVYKPREEI